MKVGRKGEIVGGGSKKQLHTFEIEAEKKKSSSSAAHLPAGLAELLHVDGATQCDDEDSERV